MTTGRINQVATIRVTPEAPKNGAPARGSLVCVEFLNCVLASVSQLSCTTAPLQRPCRNFLLEEATPPGERAQLHQRHGVRPLLGTPPSCASRCVEFLYGRLKQPLIHTTPKEKYRSSRVRTSGARCLNAKKEKRTRRFANQRFARCHRGAENPQPREVRKREERK